METDNKPIGKDILCVVKEVIENTSRSTKKTVNWKQFLKLQLVKEILATGKQK